MKHKAFYAVIALVVIIVIFQPGRHARNYQYYPVSEVFDQLVATENLRSNLNICSTDFYRRLITSGAEIDAADIYKYKSFTTPERGGEYAPSDCMGIFKVAVIVPYRNRKEHLQIFLNYFHTFLQHQKIHYKIFIVDQNDSLPFNRAKMLNIGAKEAMKQHFPCLILHDVDLFPLNPQNIYACSKRPRHVSSSIDTFRFNLPYLTLCGGVFAIAAKDFQKVNGMSNEFEGWGGEDDDFCGRLEADDLAPYRFAPEISRYTMLFHKKEKASKDRYEKLKGGSERKQVEGLNTITNNYKVVLEPLYTHIIV